MDHETVAVEAIKLAQTNLNHEAPMLTSAQMCLNDAKELWLKADFKFAAKRALKSMGYSVGIFHPAYQQCLKMIDHNGMI